LLARQSLRSAQSVRLCVAAISAAIGHDLDSTLDCQPNAPGFSWKSNWWPVAFTRDLDASQPSAFTLLGEQLVLWHDGTSWRAFADRCPHRLAPLSEGRVTPDGCAYLFRFVNRLVRCGGGDYRR